MRWLNIRGDSLVEPTQKSELLKNREQIFKDHYQTYRKHWYLICLRYQRNSQNADDALQNGMIKIFKSYHQFDETKGSFKAWSSKVMVNENLLLIRKNKSAFAFDELTDRTDSMDNSETPIDRMSMEELVLMVQKLPAGYRSVFNLYVIEGYSHKEIAELLNISVGTSKSQLFKAKKILKSEIEHVF